MFQDSFEVFSFNRRYASSNFLPLVSQKPFLFLFLKNKNPHKLKYSPKVSFSFLYFFLVKD